MPLDPSAVGRITDPIRVEWSWKECALYALGVGAGTDDLAFTTENTRGVVQRMLPTMPSILGKDFGVLEHLGRYDPHHLVHAGQVVELVQEVPTNASGIAQTSIVDMWDQGSSAIVLTETELRNDIDHSVLFRTRAFLLFKGEGGWGGNRMPPQVEELHERDPEELVTARAWTCAGTPTVGDGAKVGAGAIVISSPRLAARSCSGRRMPLSVGNRRRAQ